MFSNFYSPPKSNQKSNLKENVNSQRLSSPSYVPSGNIFNFCGSPLLSKTNSPTASLTKFSPRERPWGVSISPQVNNLKTPGRLSSAFTTYRRIKNNSDSLSWGDVCSPGFSSRIAEYSREGDANSPGRRRPTYSRPGDFPRVILDPEAKKLPVLNVRNVDGNRRSVGSPFPSKTYPGLSKWDILTSSPEDPKKQLVECLRNFNNKRSRSDIEDDIDYDDGTTSSAAKRQCKQDSKSSETFHNGTPCAEKRVESVEKKKKDTPEAKKKFYNNEIYSSLSSSRNLFQSARFRELKRKANTSLTESSCCKCFKPNTVSPRGEAMEEKENKDEEGEPANPQPADESDYSEYDRTGAASSSGNEVYKATPRRRKQPDVSKRVNVENAKTSAVGNNAVNKTQDIGCEKSASNETHKPAKSSDNQVELLLEKLPKRVIKLSPSSSTVRVPFYDDKSPLRSSDIIVVNEPSTNKNTSELSRPSEEQDRSKPSTLAGNPICKMSADSTAASCQASTAVTETNLFAFSSRASSCSFGKSTMTSPSGSATPICTTNVSPSVSEKIDERAVQENVSAPVPSSGLSFGSSSFSGGNSHSNFGMVQHSQQSSNTGSTVERPIESLDKSTNNQSQMIGSTNLNQSSSEIMKFGSNISQPASSDQNVFGSSSAQSSLASFGSPKGEIKFGSTSSMNENFEIKAGSSSDSKTQSSGIFSGASHSSLSENGSSLKQFSLPAKKFSFGSTLAKPGFVSGSASSISSVTGIPTPGKPLATSAASENNFAISSFGGNAVTSVVSTSQPTKSASTNSLFNFGNTSTQPKSSSSEIAFGGVSSSPSTSTSSFAFSSLSSQSLKPPSGFIFDKAMNQSSPSSKFNFGNTPTQSSSVSESTPTQSSSVLGSTPTQSSSVFGNTPTQSSSVFENIPTQSSTALANISTQSPAFANTSNQTSTLTFGAKTSSQEPTTPATTSVLTFNKTPQQISTPFGNSSNLSLAKSPGLNFGSSSQPSSTNSTFSFGSVSTQPTVTTSSTQFMFNSSGPATFGSSANAPATTAIGGFSFGNNSQPVSSSSGTINFGNVISQPETTSSGFTLAGNTQTPVGGFDSGKLSTTSVSTVTTTAPNLFSFGSRDPSKSASTFAFGSQTPSTSTSTFAFGSQTPSSSASTLAFGSQTPSSSANTLAFGSQTPSASASTLAFGSQTPSASASTLAFGSQTPSASASTLAFGSQTPSASASTLAFGSQTPSASASTFAFGSQTPSTSTASFGSGNSNSLNFGSQTAAQTTTASASLFQFGQSQPVTAAPLFPFGSQTQTTASSIQFGSSNTATTSASPFQFGSQTATSTPKFNFGEAQAATSTPQFGFGQSQTSTPAASFAFGSQTTMANTNPFQTPTTSASGIFSFGSAAAQQQPVKSQPAGGFSFQPAPLQQPSAATSPFAFGSSSSQFGSSSGGGFSFGNTSNTPGQQQTGASSFGFGTNNNQPSGSTGFGFGSNPAAPSSAQSLFGGNSATQQQPAGVFQFGQSNSTSQQPSGGFNFTSPSPLNFGAGLSTAGNMFLTAQTPGFPGGGTMFSIGSGSTAPRSRATRTARRHNR